MGDPLSASLFGIPEVRLHGEPLCKLRSRKTLWLFAYLVLRDGSPMSRQRLAYTFWPEVDLSTAQSNLRSVVSDLRAALGDQRHRIISVDRDSIALNISDIRIDVLEFDRAVRGRRCVQAVKLYTGEFLEGCEEEWVGQERKTRRDQMIHALETAAAEHMVRGNSEESFELYQRSAELDPLRDHPVRKMMEGLVEVGDTNRALQLYREHAHRMNREASCVPDRETTRLYERLRTEKHQASSSKSKIPRVEISLGNLPTPLSPIIGRDVEIEELETRIQQSRLTTLVGVGGIGKTRLALECGEACRPHFPDGVWFIPLDVISNEEAVVPTLAKVFGIREHAPQNLQEGLIEFLRRKKALLVLDNCEHLRGSCAEICALLLSKCSNLSILLTSREPVDIPGEIVFTVSGLSTPVPEELPPHPSTRVRVALGYESVLLFVERARSAQSDFVLDADNARMISEICSRLEGMPLAIELAAVQVGEMSLRAVADYLTDLLGENATARWAVHPRQRTLKAALDWSVDLLSPEEKTLLTSLSAFVGGWTAESIYAVSDHPDTFSHLRSLVRKSLVNFNPKADRYRMLEPIRQYLIRHADAALLARAKEMHLHWFIAFSAEARVRLLSPEVTDWCARIAADHENLLAASRVAIEIDRADDALCLLSGIFRYWYMQGEFEVGARYLTEALAASPQPSESRAEALHAVAGLRFCQQRFHDTKCYATEGLALVEDRNDLSRAAQFLNLLAGVADQENDLAYQELFQRSLEIMLSLGDVRGAAIAFANLGTIEFARGKIPEAKRLMDEGLHWAESSQDPHLLAQLQMTSAPTEIALGNFSTAEAHLQACLEFHEKISSKNGVAQCLDRMGYLKERKGDSEEAATCYRKGASLYRELGDLQHESELLQKLPLLAIDS